MDSLVSILLSMLLMLLMLLIYDIYILKQFYKLKLLLQKNNCIIITDIESNRYHTRFRNFILKKIFNNLIFDIDESIDIIKNLNNNINIVIETYGGNISSNDKILNHIIKSKLKLSTYIFKYAQSAGTLLALSGNKIYMTQNAFLGPTDPQITIDDNQYSVKALIDMCDNKDINYIGDKYVLTYFDSKKLYQENIEIFKNIINNKFKKNLTLSEKEYFITSFTDGNISHHTPFNYLYLNKYINVNMQMPKNIIEIYDLFDYIY